MEARITAPMTTRRKVLVNLKPEQYEQLRELARTLDVPVAILVRLAVDRWLHEQQATPQAGEPATLS